MGNPQIDDDVVNSLVLSEYSFGPPDSSTLISSASSDTYEIRFGDTRYALRIHKPSWWIRGEGDFRFELGLLSHLHAAGVPVAVAMPRRNGDPLGRIGTSGRFYTLFEWAPGTPSDNTEDRVHLLGETLALIHVAADSFQTQFPRYCLDAANLIDRPLTSLKATTMGRDGWSYVQHMAADLHRRVRGFDTGSNGWGIIHGDVHSLNFHFTTAEDITALDFDLCGYGWRVYDYAYYQTRIPRHLREPFAAGYREWRRLTREEVRMIPTMGRIAWIREGVDLNSLVKFLKDPFIPEV